MTQKLLRRPAFSLALCAALLPPLASGLDSEPLFSPVPASAALPGAFDQAVADLRWETLSLQYFGERPILEGDDQNVVRISAPLRTENDAMVPVSVRTVPPALNGSHIAKVYLIVDINPMPIAGLFTLTEQRPLEEIATRVRVNGYTYVRAVVEADDGKLYMDKQLVKSRGVACNAPPVTPPEEAVANLGKMRFKFLPAETAGESGSVQLLISHPNATGMQKDQVSLLNIPEHYVKQIELTLDEHPVLLAETSFSISENPSFRFGFDASEQGELKARIVDTKGNIFQLASPLQAH